MKRIAKSAAILGVLVCGWHGAAGQEAPIASIEWQVEDRFRFFARPAIFRPHEAANLAFEQAPSALDQFGRKSVNGEWVGPVLFAERTLARQAISEGHDGWAARDYAATNGKATCWNTKLRRVREDCNKPAGGEGSRLFPLVVDISARLSGAAAQLFAGKVCEWFLHTGQDPDWKLKTQVDCAQMAGLKVPVNRPFSLLARVLDPASPAGIMTQVTSVYQQVQGRLVVGLGDSYASGEGNPDYPASYTKAITLADTFRPRPTTLPRWLDPACHRSVYSHQQRVAMQLAAENRQAVVSFLGYACSGSTIPNVLDETDADDDLIEPVTSWSLKQDGVFSGADTVLAQAEWSQLDHLMRDLCADKGAATREKPIKRCAVLRKIPDLVLLTVGGNDAGFSRVLKWAVTGSAAGHIRYLTGGRPPEELVDQVRGKERLSDCDNSEPGYQCSLPKRYASLAAAIENRLGLTDRSRVIVSPYPGSMGNELGSVCTADALNAGMDSEHFVATDARRIEALHNNLFADRQLTKALKQAVAGTGWTWVDSLSWSGAFNRHGICATGKRPADALNVVQLIRQKWTPASPADMLAYASRQRWFRTFNDSILMQFYVTRIDQLARRPRQPVDYHYQAGISGFFHPTAEGQAAMADMLLPAARCKLFGTSAQC